MHALQPYLTAALVLLTYLGFSAWCLLRHKRSRPTAVILQHGQAISWLIAYASQGGSAEKIARLHAQQLAQARQSVVVLPLNKVDQQQLSAHNKALFVVSTYGEGEPPDNGSAFARRFLQGGAEMDLSSLDYAVLALGDRDYRRYCAFGEQLHQGLEGRGARPLFDWVDVNKGDQQALQLWQHRLAEATGLRLRQAATVTDAKYVPWRLVQRQCLNPGSSAAPVLLLRFEAVGDLPQWQAGDIAQVRVGTHASAPVREYSIASIAENGALELVVRLRRTTDGHLGLGSTYLSQELVPRQIAMIRLRSNPSFRAPSPDRPAVLIGSGTGIAGLRAILRAREQQGANANWLIFGERTRAHDALFKQELADWQASGHLQRMDLVYSRETFCEVSFNEGPAEAYGVVDCGNQAARYVQDVLHSAGPELKKRVTEGAAIYVCGSKNGMGRSVDQTLRKLLGKDCLDHLADVGRYCRDVY